MSSSTNTSQRPTAFYFGKRGPNAKNAALSSAGLEVVQSTSERLRECQLWIQVAEKTYKDSFDDELKQFKARITKRAAEKIQEALREQEEEERQARLGPGGLDPVEVYEELPDMPETEAIYFMKRCVDSGLWVPGKNDDEPKEKPEGSGDSTEAPVTSTSTEEVD
ncbi:HSP90 cochaperone CDC37-like proteinue [Operophtera brumata]|uniref:HSP90 cochaperone CDC37-like proteinue n=1 Tax=Operophtera brumata TaxID=104452 RepID=A0A0L7L2R0_OPEBR|nr:HSP90 cochaperone CDC37-like proteinue [Operophtera brumata]